MGTPAQGLAVSFPMLPEHQPLIVNVVGHLAGALVFAIFLALALRGGARRSRVGWLSVASAALALIWNAGSLAMLLLPAGSLRWSIEALSFGCLSLLPAVLLHLSLDGGFRGLAAAGYSVSVCATAMHLGEGFARGPALHQWALWIITIGFGALTALYSILLLRRGKHARARTSQFLAAMALLLFAVTFSHFGAGQAPQPWREVFVHHAGIPLALLLLLRDYRFVFLDAFVRFLANVLLAGILGYAGLRLAGGLAPAIGPAGPLSGVFAVAGLCALLVVFAYLREAVQRLLTNAVFRSGGVAGALQELRSKALEIRGEAEYLQWAAGRIAALFGTPQFEVLGSQARPPGAEAAWMDLDYPVRAGDDPRLARDPRWSWAETAVPIRLPQRDGFTLLLGRRRGGRPYLSEDLRSLSSLANGIAEEVVRRRAAEMERLAAEAELRALQSQINPHFLFNALNTIYGIIPREAAGAREAVLNLAAIFRYFLHSDRVLIPLSEELEIIRAYLAIERLRLGPRLRTDIAIDPAAERAMIPALSVQPLVENAVRYALSKRAGEGWLKLSATADGGALTIAVEDSGAGDGAESPGGAGVALANVTRRLQLCFGPEAGVSINRAPSGTRVQFSAPLERPVGRR